ncbi:hypothetical protein [Deinococcus fonticola]|uniref:hypothetical protein n=1 Tax=Deinococcus fonticola TaxID=2528713 RepID=UPI0010752F35|nr:hypothetical protein [Deinococcus fonticola]
MTNIPALPQNIDPRIAEILRQKAQKGIAIQKTEVPRLRPQAAEAPTDPVPPREIPVGTPELSGMLVDVLSIADTLIRRAIDAVRSDGRLTMVEALALVPDIRNIVSEVVGRLLPEIKGQSAYDLVSLVLAVLVQQYVSPHLPALLRPYLTARAIRTAINGLQWAYDTWVKPRLKSPRP